MQARRLTVPLALLAWGAVFSGPAPGLAQRATIGAAARLPDNARRHYSRYVNWRPADGETVRLNPPRFSWPYWPDWPGDWSDAVHTFRLQISRRPDCSQPVVDVACPLNFYNTLPELRGARRWYWRVGYDVGTANERWSPVRRFAIAEDAVPWDRAALASPDLAARGHPRILFNRKNLPAIRRLAETNPDSQAALAYIRSQADAVLQKPWWRDFPRTDREALPRQEFYRIAGDLAMAAFAWRMTGDPKYAGVKERAVTLASYPPGGRASPEGLGGDGNEDATQTNEFLALLFDWLYPDLSESERRVMIRSLEWRTDYIMNAFSWRKASREARRRFDAGGLLADSPPGSLLVRNDGMSGMIHSHGYEAAMDTAVCGLALYEHSRVGREWFDLVTNYLIGVTCGHGFDEAWNEGPGYGTSKCKWLMNASLYFDTALPEARLGRNPFYRRIGDWFCRVIPVGMPHNAWGNQANASRGNHLAHMRKFAYLTGEGRFLLNWRQYGGRRFAAWRPWIEYVLPAYYDPPEPAPESDPVGVFPIGGWGMAATGPPSLGSTFQTGAGLVFQCRPRGGFGHSFNSDNSFQLFAYGRMLNHGGGSSANKDAYAYHTMSHNTVLVDGLGQAQPTHGQLLPAYGRLIGFARGSDYVYFAGDATGCYPKQPGRYARWGLPLDPVYQRRALPYLERFVRHILMLRGRYFVLYDELACSRPATFTWLYHILPEGGLQFDPATFAADYTLDGVRVRVRHAARPDELELEDRRGLDGFVNPITGEDYRPWRKAGPVCAHNLWVRNRRPARQWRFLAVVYPAPPGERLPRIERLDDATVRVGGDVVCFDRASQYAKRADWLVDVAALRR